MKSPFGADAIVAPLAALALPALLLVAQPAAAQTYPLLVGDGHFELRFDAFPQSDDPANERHDVNLHGDANFGLFATPELSLQSSLKVE